MSEIFFAKQYIVDEYDVSRSVAEDIAKDAAQAAWLWLRANEFMQDNHRPVGERREAFEALERETVERSDGSASEPLQDVQEEAVGDVEQQTEDGPEVEAPGEDWLCECGAYNEGERAVCRNGSCGKAYEELAD